ncbi:MAG TPA: quinoprotein dehydrogenase-associated putative ABC transporter substrate-binding protein [Rhizomicrobium sp.]|jgi:quinoprotein dehydrogenase-associated probable ABC transporter substrate-binding protein|nr:quinoprotein dehydrogenase-associated putative ABC transporter substrate-binding protein [Rhizomicrobium sp.]
MRRASFCLAALILAPPVAQATTFRVCSEPNNLPFSNRAGEGFENKIADLVAHDLGEKLEYAFALQTDKFVKRTLDAHKCDVMMGVPAGMNEVETTAPYYASTYVFVSRARDRLALSSFNDPRLRKLKIGVHLLGDESSPPALALAQRGIVNNVRGFLIYGDYAKANPPARLIEAVADRRIDVAAAWGPLAGYFAKQSSTPLAITRIAAAPSTGPLKFRFAIAMGVRKGDVALRDRLDAVIANERNAIHKILVAYGIPLVALSGGADG